MRTEALEKWYVPQIFEILPFLLKAVLGLFSGVVDFLLDFSHAVAIPLQYQLDLPYYSLFLQPFCRPFSVNPPVSLRQPLFDGPVPA